ncbi:MAG: 4-(cytidine 5'-diphospho)-2-C-methyl-D-erythritol kinase [Parcubacteria group bacterium]|jgi:4-diphosphocytidyl-2-C-methyl-D-erythritol kinase
MKTIKTISPAKINLTLEIIEKLPDGFHGLRSVMLKAANLADEVDLIFDEKQTGIQIICTDPSIPTDEKNICWKIAEKFFAVSGSKVGLIIKLKKHIPALAGLGGGSSNGATTLLALNEYFGQPLKFEALVELAATVGKDIPVFLLPEQAVLVSGAGEKLKSIPYFPKLSLLLINPHGEMATGWAYGELDRRMWFMANEGRKNISLQMLKDIDKREKIGQLLYNDFSLIAEEAFPVIGEIQNCLRAFGALGVSITGKGPTVVGIFRTAKEALAIQVMLRKNYPDFWVAVA